MIDLSPLDRHDKIALSFSGGKDSLAVVYLLRAYLDRLTIYHMDTGDLLPETREIVEHVKSFAPHFVHIEGDVSKFIAEYGLPTDLLPHGAHPIGQAMGEPRTPLVARYDCCWRNLMLPIFSRIVEDGNTLLIRGTKRVDMRRLPMASGGLDDRFEYFYPIQDWSNDEVFAYLREAGAPISRVYQHVTNSPECARCTAWWGERRAEYLKQYHPQLYQEYRARLDLVAQEIVRAVENLRHELAHLELL
jgi:phosphoadenosine phosphosulfate reductase